MDEIIEHLVKAVLEYDSAGGEHWTEDRRAKKAVEAKTDPLKAIEALTSAIRQVGDGYGRGELWLPELVGGASATQSALPIIEEQLRKEKKPKKAWGLVVIGAVFGDIHNIGKNMVATLLIAGGFEVIGLGINIKVLAGSGAVIVISADYANILELCSLTAATNCRGTSSRLSRPLPAGAQTV
jgi:methanogenic corrinoid protein MtbC1